jgi:hypothetical protein
VHGRGSTAGSSDSGGTTRRYQRCHALLPGTTQRGQLLRRDRIAERSPFWRPQTRELTDRKDFCVESTRLSSRSLSSHWLAGLRRDEGKCKKLPPVMIFALSSVSRKRSARHRAERDKNKQGRELLVHKDTPTSADQERHPSSRRLRGGRCRAE